MIKLHRDFVIVCSLSETVKFKATPRRPRTALLHTDSGSVKGKAPFVSHTMWGFCLLQTTHV